MPICKKYRKKRIYNVMDRIDDDLIFGVLTPLSAIFQLYHGYQF
jgi:hypothetical protein